MAEDKGISLTILGVVAVIAIVGLVLLFTGAGTGGYVAPGNKVYGGAIQEKPYPYLQGRKVSGVAGDQYSAQYTSIPSIPQSRDQYKIPNPSGCPAGTYGYTSTEVQLGRVDASACTPNEIVAGTYCCTDPRSEYIK